MAGPNDAHALLLTLSADTSKITKSLDALSKRVSGLAPELESKGKRAMSGLERGLGKPGVGKALDNVFDRSRLAVIEAGTARIPVFGSALEALGPQGVAAAAGVAALTAAIVAARQAAAFADELGDTADKLHVTTDALQEYRYAIRAAGGEEKDADAALEAFSVTLGQAQAGFAKAQKGFLLLGFTKEQIKGFQDVETTLPKVSEALQGMSDSQKDAALSALGLKPLQQLLDDGPTQMAALRDEAHRLGLVMDAELVKRGGEINDQFDTVTKVIDVQLKSALVDLGPILVGILGLVADIARAAGDVVDKFRSIEAKRSEGLRKEIADLKTQRDTGKIKVTTADRLLGSVPVIGPALEAGRLAGRGRMSRADLDKQIALREAELKRREEANAPPAVTRPPVDLSGGGGGGSGRKARAPRDTSGARTAAVDDQLLGLERELLSAWQDLVVGADQRAEIAKMLLDVEREDFQNKVARQAADIQADDGLTQAKKDQLTAALESARIEYDKIDDLRREKIDRDLAEQKSRDALSVRQAEFDVQEDALHLAEGMARTQAERRDIQLQLLDLADKRARVEYEALLASKTASEADKDIARIKLQQLKDTRGARQAAVMRSTQGPWESYIDRLPATIGEVNEAFQGLAAGGVSDLIDGLAAAGAGAADVGDVVRRAFQQMAIDANRILLQSLLSGAASGGGGGFLGSLFKIGASAFGGGYTGAGGPNAIMGIDGGFIPFATGGSFTVGGMAGIDRNLVKMRVSRGERVTVETAEQQRLGALPSQSNTFHFPGVTDARDARVLEKAVAAGVGRAYALAAKQGIRGG